MLVEFDVRPRDSRMFEAWQSSKYRLSRLQFFVMYFLVMAAAAVYAYQQSRANFLLILIACCGTFVMLDVTLEYVFMRFRERGT
jgi:hypothetical membrane protein